MGSHMYAHRPRVISSPHGQSPPFPPPSLVKPPPATPPVKKTTSAASLLAADPAPAAQLTFVTLITKESSASGFPHLLSQISLFQNADEGFDKGGWAKCLWMNWNLKTFIELSSVDENQVKLQNCLLWLRKAWQPVDRVGRPRGTNIREKGVLAVGNLGVHKKGPHHHQHGRTDAWHAKTHMWRHAKTHTQTRVDTLRHAHTWIFIHTAAMESSERYKFQVGSLRTFPTFKEPITAWLCKVCWRYMSGKQWEGIIRIEEALSLSDSCVWRRATISKLPNYQITPPTTQHPPRGCAPCVSLEGALGERVRGEELVWKGGQTPKNLISSGWHPKIFRTKNA